MKKVLIALCAAVALACLQSAVMADAPAAEKSECSGCPVTKAMDALPKLTYKVGDEETCCSATAAKLAEADGAHMHYVVAEKEYDAKEEAMVALADVTEKFVSDFATPHTCDVSGKTSICGSSMGCEVSAGKLAEKAKAAMKLVSLSYKVGDEECSCPNHAASLAKESGAQKHFVIGEESTCCEVDARIKLARAKYAAAVKAIQPEPATAG